MALATSNRGRAQAAPNKGESNADGKRDIRTQRHYISGVMTRSVLLLLILLLLTGTAVPAGWYGAAALLERSFQAWVQERQAEGYAVRHGPAEIDGFPLSLQARIPEPVVESPRDWRWKGPELLGQAVPWEPLTIQLQSPGRHRLEWGPREAPVALDLHTNAADGTAVLAIDGRLREADAKLTDVTAAGPLPGPLRIDSLTLSFRESETGAAHPGNLLLSALNVELPPGFDPPLGHQVELLMAQGRVMGPLPVEASRESLALWRDAGGLLDIEHMELRWGPLSLEAKGQVGLDRELRLSGKLTSSLRGGSEALEVFAKRQMIGKRAAGALKLAIFALSRDAGDGGPPVVELPVSLKDGLFFLGPVALFQLPPVL